MTKIRPPASRLGPATLPERQATLAASPVRGLYDTPLDRESAFEALKAKAGLAARQAEDAAAAAEADKRRAAEEKAWERERTQRDRYDRQPAPRARASNRQSMGEAFGKTLVRTIASQVGREILRGVLGGLKRR